MAAIASNCCFALRRMMGGVILIVLVSGDSEGFAQGTVFTYQGLLKEGTQPAAGMYDLRFELFSQANGGAAVGEALTNRGVAVLNGVFSVALDFGDVFDGSPRWLGIGVRTNGGSSFRTLAPRQALTATPYAIFSSGTKASGITGTVEAKNIAAATITGEMLAPGAATANLATGGMAGVPNGGMVLSANAYASNLMAAGYVRLGGQLNMAWQRAADSGAPSARGNHTAVWTGNGMIVWGGDGPGGVTGSGSRYVPGTGVWEEVATNNAPSGRTGHSAVWTGSEMIVWGGIGGTGLASEAGRYNPTEDRWTAVSSTNSPAPRQAHGAVWTGMEMVVWGGSTAGDVKANTGGRYSAVQNGWQATATNGAPSGRMLHSMVWTGAKVVVWGGTGGEGVQFNDGGRYDPGSDSWLPVSTNGAPSPRYQHSAVWTGTEMIVWGGYATVGQGQGTTTVALDDGGRYDPMTDSWRPLSKAGGPSGRAGHTAVWTGTEMVVWGGCAGTNWLRNGGRYDPIGDRWAEVTTDSAPSARQGHSAVWSGSEVIVFGGYDGGATYRDIYGYAPWRVMYLYLKQ